MAHQVAAYQDAATCPSACSTVEGNPPHCMLSGRMHANTHQLKKRNICTSHSTAACIIQALSGNILGQDFLQGGGSVQILAWVWQIWCIQVRHLWTCKPVSILLSNLCANRLGWTFCPSCGENCFGLMIGALKCDSCFQYNMNTQSYYAKFFLCCLSLCIERSIIQYDECRATILLMKSWKTL